MKPRILVAGIGNLFLGDDGFGVEVVQRLGRCDFPAEVQVVDFGIRGFDLVYALMDDYDHVILIDAVPRGGEPGTLYTIEPDLSALEAARPEDMMVDTHGMNPMRVLGVVHAMGGQPKHILLVGCEPSASSADDEEQIGLSDSVAAAVDEAVVMVQSLIAKLSTKEFAAAP